MGSLGEVKLIEVKIGDSEYIYIIKNGNNLVRYFY